MEELRCFTVQAMVRGYHTYKDIWEASVGEELACQRETDNPHDRFAVAVVNNACVVGHLPRKISSVSSIFIRRGGSILCRVTGCRRYSHDLPQGGLEIRCTLIFEGNAKYTEKAKLFVKEALRPTNETETLSPAEKKRKLEKIESPTGRIKDGMSDTDCTEDSLLWIQDGGITLLIMDRDIISKGDWLNDKIINFVQAILKKQFPMVLGLQSTLLQTKKPSSVEKNNRQLQIVHSRGNHWIVASTLVSFGPKVMVYDSVYQNIDSGTECVIKNLFGHSLTIHMVHIPKQDGGQDCGVFAIAIATALAYGMNVATLKFNQVAMRPHLIQCIESKTMTCFPCA